jgi:L-lactate dehydrogenase complex protein LldG
MGAGAAVMSEARAAILARLREALDGDGQGIEARRRAAEARIAARAPGTIPARADLPLEERITLFIAQAEAVQAVVRRVEDTDGVPPAIAELLRARNLPLQLVIADHPLLAGADWPGAMLEVRTGRVRESDPVGVTAAIAAVAETGTVMLASSPQTPTLTAFLPETAIVVMPSARVLRAYEDAIALLREEQGALPRSVNFVTGPSRTGDIELTLQLGAHGPKHLFVLLVDGPAAARA